MLYYLNERNVESMTYAEAFSKIKKKLEKADTKALNQDFAIQVTIKDEDAAGTFYVANINGEFSVEPYDYRDNSVAVDVTVTDFTKLIEGKLTSEKALSSGKIDAFGDAAALDFITGIVKPTPRKTAAKKETAKKTTAKKETPAKKTKRKTTAVKEEKTAAAAEAAPAAKSDEKPAKKSPAKNTDK
ncbi:MAG: SCP2 sterol-binding domain-containing protein [Clostridia bacterium]|nr:SCP2 sterol-binding domain-containing protein [Clostridia bacterium]